MPTCPVVGIGASAGGLAALQELVSHLAASTGMAFVVVQHLDPDHKSLLPEILSRATSMPVSQGLHGMPVGANSIYVVPPDRRITIAEGTLRLAPRAPRGRHFPVDEFLRSLATDCRSRSIAVILSGSGSDGVEGVRAVKEEGGLTFAQDKASAEFQEMPQSATASGAIDFILRPAEIARELNRIGRHPFALASTAPSTAELGSREQEAFVRILELLRKKTDIDFVHYKHPTLKRRVLRRMALSRTDGMNDYLELLSRDGAEVRALAEDVLIKVTSFFRDPHVFEAIAERVFPALLQRRRDGSTVRIWVPGCSTGEEAYSIAICAREALARRRRAPQVQIFATDVDPTAIERAREAQYPFSIEKDVSPARLRRFFLRSGPGYKVHPSIREMCLFARHDLLKDPPFSRMELVSCRNVLIYLSPLLQQKAIGIFQYALEKGGFLLLGNAERIPAAEDLFRVVDSKARILAKKAVSNVLGPLRVGPAALVPDGPLRASGDEPIRREVERRLILRPAMGCVVVDDDLEVVQSHGAVAAFVAPVEGEAVPRPGSAVRLTLVKPLRKEVRKAIQGGSSTATRRATIRRSGKPAPVSFEVSTIDVGNGSPRVHLVLLDPHSPLKELAPIRALRRNGKAGRTPSISSARVTPTKLRTLLEEYEVTNEELMSANEEVQSSNEELQSTNEELETAREEMQSSNEELTTLNDELKDRNEELNKVNADLSSLLNSVDLPLLILGANLEIRRMSPAAASLLHLKASDVGRRLSELEYEFEIPNLARVVREVLDRSAPQELLVAASTGHARMARVRPSLTTDYQVDGVILTWTPVSGYRDRVRGPWEVSQALLDASAVPRAIVDGGLRVEVANAAWRSLFGSKERPDASLGVCDQPPWTDPELRTALRAVATGDSALDGRRVEVSSEGSAVCRYDLSATRLPWESSDDFRVLVTLQAADEGSSGV